MMPKLTRCPAVPSKVNRAFCPGLLSVIGTEEPPMVITPDIGSERIKVKLAVVAPGSKDRSPGIHNNRIGSSVRQRICIEITSIGPHARGNQGGPVWLEY